MDTLGSHLSDVLIQKMFRIFLLFTEESDYSNSDKDTVSVIKHHIHQDEVQFIFSLIAQQISPIHASYDVLSTTASKENTKGFDRNKDLLTFKDFVQLSGEMFPSRSILEPAVAFVYDQLVNQLLKKGLTLKKSENSGFLKRAESWKIASLKVFPGRVYISVFSKGQLSQAKPIILNKQCKVLESKSEAGKWFWTLKHAEKDYYFASTDKLECHQWITVLELAIARSEQGGNFHRNLFCKRKLQRTHQTSTCSQNLRDLLENERKLRLQLESENNQLLDQLEQEQQAVRDEGIVRNVAARMLEEERIRREKLEVLNSEQEILLQREQEYRKLAEKKERERSEELMKLKNQLEVLRTQQESQEALSNSKIRSNSGDRKNLLDQLKKDQEDLLKYQNDLKIQTVQYRDAQTEFFREIGGTLERLKEKSRKRNSATETILNGSVRHKIVFTPSRSSSESS